MDAAGWLSIKRVALDFSLLSIALWFNRGMGSEMGVAQLLAL